MQIFNIDDVMHHIKEIPESELPCSMEELESFSYAVKLPYEETVAVAHAISTEYGGSFARKVLGIYISEGRDVPLNSRGFNGEDPLEVMRRIIDDDLGIDVPYTEMRRMMSFASLVMISEQHRKKWIRD